MSMFFALIYTLSNKAVFKNQKKSLIILESHPYAFEKKKFHPYQLILKYLFIFLN